MTQETQTGENPEGKPTKEEREAFSKNVRLLKALGMTPVEATSGAQVGI
jgi:hypothetical protein